jgi:hypothetical protein
MLFQLFQCLARHVCNPVCGPCKTQALMLSVGFPVRNCHRTYFMIPVPPSRHGPLACLSKRWPGKKGSKTLPCLGARKTMSKTWSLGSGTSCRGQQHLASCSSEIVGLRKDTFPIGSIRTRKKTVWLWSASLRTPAFAARLSCVSLTGVICCYCCRWCAGFLARTSRRLRSGLKPRPR